MQHLNVPAREGRGVVVRAGESIQVITPHGQQAADFFAFNADDRSEWLSPNHTWVWSRRVRPRAGDVLLSRHRRAMLDFTEDGADGVHDMMIAACDHFRYEQLGHVGPHASCADNLRLAMQRLGHSIDVVPQPINFFTHTDVTPAGEFVALPNPVPAGAYVTLRARMDVICVVSSCPYDLDIADWSINAPGGPTELEIRVLAAEEAPDA